MTKMDEEWEMHNVDELLLFATKASDTKHKIMYLSGAAAITLLRDFGFGHPHNNPPVPPDNRIVDAHKDIMESYANPSGGGNKIKKTKRRNPKKSVRHRRHRMKSVRHRRHNKKSIRHRKKTLMSY
jgi:hypothetical protein